MENDSQNTPPGSVGKSVSSIFRTFLQTSAYEQDHGAEEGRKFELATGVLYMTTPAFLLFSVYHAVHRNILPVIFNLILVFVQLLHIFVLSKTKWRNTGFRITLMFYGIYFYIAIILGGPGGSYAVWSVFFPVLATIFLSRKEGLLWVVLFLAGYLVLAFLGPYFIAMNAYPHNVLIRLFVIQVILAVLIYQIEKTRLKLIDSLRQREKEIIDEKKRSDDATGTALDALQVKSRFLATVSHEIRTPLSLITGMSELAVIEKDPSMVEEYLNDIYDSSQHLLMLINNLLDFSKIESDKFTFENDPFDLQKLAEKIVKSFVPEFNRKGLVIQFSYDEEMNRLFMGDKMRIRQIITNLISNSYKYTERGGVSISFGMSEADKSINAKDLPGFCPVCISVEDTGIGIPEDKYDDIFNPFRQVSMKEEASAGVGLGLAISKRLIEMMGGRITVSSAEGEGTVFTIVIPFLPLEETAGMNMMKEETDADEKRKLKVLFADDNPAILKMVMTVLMKAGHSISCVGNGYEALSALHNHAFDVILLDVEMPQLNGTETARRIRRGDAGEDISRVPIIALTAHAISDIEERCREVEMDGLIKKPFELSSLEKEIRKIIREKQERDGRH